LIRTTLKSISEAMPALQLLLAAKLPVKAAYAVGKLSRACANEMEQYERDRAKLFAEAGCVVDEKANKYVHKDDATIVEKVSKEASEMLDAECEIVALPLDIEQFGNAEVPGAAFFGLDWAMKKEGP
jgi:hypothetical protein